MTPFNIIKIKQSQGEKGGIDDDEFVQQNFLRPEE